MNWVRLEIYLHMDWRFIYLGIKALFEIKDLHKVFIPKCFQCLCPVKGIGAVKDTAGVQQLIEDDMQLDQRL